MSWSGTDHSIFISTYISIPREEFFKMLFHKYNNRIFLFMYYYIINTSKLNVLKQQIFYYISLFFDQKFIQDSAGHLFWCGVYKGHSVVSAGRYDGLECPRQLYLHVCKFGGDGWKVGLIWCYWPEYLHVTLTAWHFQSTLDFFQRHPGFSERVLQKIASESY